MVTVTALVADAGARTEISPEDAQSDVEGHQVRLAASSRRHGYDNGYGNGCGRFADGVRRDDQARKCTAPLFDAAATTLTYVAGTNWWTRRCRRRAEATESCATR